MPLHPLHFSQLPAITGGTLDALAADMPIVHILTDSRKAVSQLESVFFAIHGLVHDGHRHIKELYSLGVRHFVIELPVDVRPYPGASFLRVENTVQALQKIASYHRSQFHIPVIGITGSNGKTIIKEWLYQLLSPDMKIVKNPGSYNSQLGVSLAVWQMQAWHECGIFEAGISKPGEMQRLETIIRPTLGIFANIGTAHNQGFESQHQKIEEKLKLFARVQTLIYCADILPIWEQVSAQKIPSLTWAFNAPADIRCAYTDGGIRITYQSQSQDFRPPTLDNAFVENACHCMALLLAMGKPLSVIAERVQHIKPIAMRLELKDAIRQSQIIDDTYNNDLGGLKVSVDFLKRLPHAEKSIILSEFYQTGLTEEALAKTVVETIRPVPLHFFVGIGSFFMSHRAEFSALARKAYAYATTEDFLNAFDINEIQNEAILVKGARVFHFENIVNRLQKKAHHTVMEVDLNKLTRNLNFFKTQLRPNVKLMVMVKALAYGSGSEEVAALLQHNQVDYLGVAYPDEGVVLREKNIRIPIMVMNVAESQFDALLSHRLEPVVYSLVTLRALAAWSCGRQISAHIELETGMRRLGFESKDLPEAAAILAAHPHIRIASIFSHLAAADEAAHDAFTHAQAARFERGYQTLSQSLNIRPLRHLLNSAGILRHPQYQFNMVRLGIGLYGINPTQETAGIELAVALKTVISQIKKISAGDTVGYGRRGKAEHDITIATIAIGYADGFSRAFSCGRGAVIIRGMRAPVVGNVCMDMSMVDVTHISGAREGDPVTVFGDELPIAEVAQVIDTIPYEILTQTSVRVKRVFIAD